MDLFVIALVLLVCFLFYSVNKPSHTPNDNASSHSVTTAVLPKEPAARVEAESSLRQRTVKSAEHSGGTHQVPTLPKEPQVVDEEDTKKSPTMEEVPIVPVEHTTPITSQHLEDKVQESNDEVAEDANDTDNASDGFESDESNDADEADLSEVTHSASFSTPTPLIAACASLQGMRPNNEDRFVIEGLASSCIFAVFDGHDGPAASEYCAKHLTRAIQASKKFPKDTTSALTDTFLLLDRKFLDKGQDGGSTAIVVCVSDKIYVASAGDSRCIAGIDGKAVALSVDHKPDLEQEKERIEAANHEVQQKVEIVLGKRTKVARVDGKLAVSRAIGDSDFKDDPSAPATEQAVTALPDIQSVEVNSVNFMVLACDGLFDVMSNQDVVDYITPRLQSVDGPDQLAALAKELVSHAITNLGSADNVTAVLLKFN